MIYILANLNFEWSFIHSGSLVVHFVSFVLFLFYTNFLKTEYCKMGFCCTRFANGLVRVGVKSYKSRMRDMRNLEIAQITKSKLRATVLTVYPPVT